ncbi:PTS IIA-like nitrogen regulatory protein PtsN [Aurantivibrio infirmus]
MPAPMDIKSLLSPSRTLCGLSEASKKRVLEHVAKVIAQDYPALNPDELFQQLISRERLGSTGIGQGIAIPHCRISNCPNTIAALIKLDKPVDFGSIDDAPVDIVFALVVPDEAHEQHLQTLASLAEVFKINENIEHVRKANTEQELYDTAVSLFDK